MSGKEWQSETISGNQLNEIGEAISGNLTQLE